MIYITAARKAYLESDITKFGLIITPHNPADGLSKVKYNCSLDKLIQTVRDSFPVEKCIFVWIKKYSRKKNGFFDYDEALFCN